jgi:hypothetical protein
MADKNHHISDELSTSVSGRILKSFVDAVGEIKGMEDVAARLHDVVIVKKQFSERALREALFGKMP